MKRAAIYLSLALLFNGCGSSGKVETLADTLVRRTESQPPSNLFEADIDPFIDLDGMSEAGVKELFGMMNKADQRYRDSLYSGRKENEILYSRKMGANDEANLKLLGKIVQKFGWPRISVFGEEVAETAWLIIWHQRSKRHVLCQYFDLMERAVAAGEMNANMFEQIKEQVALLSSDQIVF